MLIRKLWPALAWAILILLLTGLPGSYFPSITSFWDWLKPDKVVHVFVFGVQAFLLLTAFHEQYLLSKNRFIYPTAILSVTIVFALLTEVLQAYVFIGRNGNVYDFIADVVGVGVGLLAYILLFKKKKANS